MTKTPDTHGLSRLELLVLARLSVVKPPSENEIAKELITYAMPDASQTQALERGREALHALRARGFATDRRALTESGRRALHDALGVAKAPPWTEVKSRFLPNLGLGLDAATKVDAEQVQATLLAEHLGMAPRKTMAAQLDQIVIEELGLPPGKVTLKRIKAALLARRAKVEARGEPEDIAKRLIAKSLGTSRADAAALRPALVRRWIAGSTNGAAKPASRRPLDDKSFASLVTDAAHDVGPDGRYGTQKVFISAVWEQLHERLDISLEELKHRLLDANRQGFLSLARADLVGAMDPGIVARSEIADANASFHFVIDAGRH